MPAVSAIANVPQNVTRAVARRCTARSCPDRTQQGEEIRAITASAAIGVLKARCCSYCNGLITIKHWFALRSRLLLEHGAWPRLPIRWATLAEDRLMLTTDTAKMLAEYGDWADQILFKAMGTLPEGSVYKDRLTLFGSMIGTLNHNYLVDLIWRAHLLGQKHGFSTRRDVLHPDLGALIKEQSEINQWYIDWATSQTMESMSERLKFNFVSGKAAEMTRGEMFLHIVNHKTYHRGWVSEMFFDCGQNPPETDICVFLTEH